MLRPMMFFVFFALAAGEAFPQAGGFTPGDLYLYSPAVQGLSSTAGALVRIDPLTGQSAIFVDLDSTWGHADGVAYDPYRNRLIFHGDIAGGAAVNELWLADGNGALQNLGFAGKPMRGFAPTGDGRIYFVNDSDTSAWIEYLDAANVAHPLLDDLGLQPLVLGANPGFDNRAMTFDAANNALYVASVSAASVACSGGSSSDVSIRKIPLDSTGSKVSGTITCAQFNVELMGAGEIPVGLSHDSGGQLLLVVDTNSNDAQNRMVSIDPATLATTAFASNGSYIGAAATNAGTWSTARGQAVILDTGNDVLRAYSAGGNGGGTVITTSTPVSSAGGSNEIATLIEIPVDPCAGAFVAYGAGLAGNGGFVPALSGGGCPEPGAAVSLSISSVVGGASGVFFLGLQQAAVPLLGGIFHVGSLILVTPVSVGGAPGGAGQGSLFVPGFLPNDVALIGLDIYFQCAFADAAAVHGASLTNGLRMEIQ